MATKRPRCLSARRDVDYLDIAEGRKRLLLLLLLQRTMVTLSEAVWVMVLFAVGDSTDRRALRVVTMAVNHAGSQAMTAICNRMAVLNGRPCGWPLAYQLMSFWSPFVGQRLIMPPLRCLGPVALARYDWMWTSCVAIGRQRRTASGRRMWIGIWGNSSEDIVHMEFVDARGWVERWRIYDERQ